MNKTKNGEIVIIFNLWNHWNYLVFLAKHHSLGRNVGKYMCIYKHDSIQPPEYRHFRMNHMDLYSTYKYVCQFYPWNKGRKRMNHPNQYFRRPRGRLHELTFGAPRRFEYCSCSLIFQGLGASNIRIYRLFWASKWAPEWRTQSCWMLSTRFQFVNTQTVKPSII